MAIAEAPALAGVSARSGSLDRAEGIELLGPVRGSGYRGGAALVRRRDGQMVQLGPLMYAVLESVNGDRGPSQLAETVSAELGRTVTEHHVLRLAQKLAAQGLLAGTEEAAPPRRNPLLALRWKVLVTNPRITERLCAPFTFLLRPWIMWPTVAAFGAVFWFVFFHKGVASATAEAFNNPTLLLLVFGLAIVSAGIHELGHAAACRYGGAMPGGMGMGLYLVWPAFYTDVTDAYRLPRRSRLRVDLAGLYFNALVADATMVLWMLTRKDALLLLVALQVLQMVKQLSPMIRADGYHILSDATGVPDLYADLGPTLRRLVPGRHRERSALTGWARLLVTLWVLIIVPILVSLMVGAILLLPKLLTSAWESGRRMLIGLPHLAVTGDVVGVLASLLHLLALLLPVLGSILITQRILRTVAGKIRQWSEGRPRRRFAVLLLAGLVLAGAAWAWWPSGQYRPVRADEVGTLTSMVRPLVTNGRPTSSAPAPVPTPGALTPGTHLAASMVPVGGATKHDPALFVIAGARGNPAMAIVATSTGAYTATSGRPTSIVGTGFPFAITSGNAQTSASATGTTNGGTKYDVAYSLVTVSGGSPVRPTNSASAVGKCNDCTTVAVSFQVVLIVGQSNLIAPINQATAANSNCPACSTTAIADQMVVTLKSQPPVSLEQKLDRILSQLNLLPLLGAGGTPAAIAAAVDSVQQQVQTVLDNSGLLTTPTASTTTTTAPPDSASTSSSQPGTTGGSSPTTTSTTTTTTPLATSTTTTTSPSSSTTTTTS